MKQIPEFPKYAITKDGKVRSVKSKRFLKPVLAKLSKPDSDEDVLREMKKYCQSKGYTFSNGQLKYMAESCYLLYESRGWCGIKYWPAVAMKWVLTNVNSQQKGKYDVRWTESYKGKMERKGKSIREKIMEQENE